MRDPSALSSVEDLYRYSRRTFQNQDPGPEAWREFHTTRMKRTENVLQFLNRLVQLSFVVNPSSSPVCRMLTENDISTRLQHGLPGHLQSALYKHLDHLIEVDKAPDMEPGSLAAIIFKLEREINEHAKKDTRQPVNNWKPRSTGGPFNQTSRYPASQSPAAMAAALPTARPSNSAKESSPATRQR
eukprot:scaffold27_cov394-Pavlova_lutheri.AAC.2